MECHSAGVCRVYAECVGNSLIEMEEFLLVVGLPFVFFFGYGNERTILCILYFKDC